MASDLRELIEKLKPFLRQYLETMGVRIRSDGKFICPSPAKHDADPSAGFLPQSNESQAHCFGCKANFDILTAANWLEGLPLKGKEFIHKTVYGLAKRFGIPFDLKDLSERDAEMLRLSQMYRDAFETLRSFWENRTHLDARGWLPHLCYEMGVATVTSWDDFLARLQSIRKYSKVELRNAGVKPAYFHPEAVTFTLFDTHGSPVGFAVRDMRFGKVDGVSKYMNTHSTLLYDKRRLVYGLHRARHESGPANIVEGYADVMSAFTFGLFNTVAVCSSTPTMEQIAGLEEAGKRDLILSLDHDVKKMPDGRPTGQGKTEDFLNKYVRGRRSVRVRITDWSAVSPNGKMDLDTFLMGQSKKGLVPEAVARSWHQIPKVDSFDWQLGILPLDMEPDQVAERMLPIIAAEPVHARQELLLNKLVGRTSIRREALERDLDAMLDLRAQQTRDRVRKVTSQAYKSLQVATPEEALQILQEAGTQVSGIVNSTDAGKQDIGSSIDQAQSVLNRFKTAGKKVIGLKVGFPTFDENMNGLCPGLWVFGGWPGHGKSSGFAQLSWNAACLNEDALILVMTIDDTLEEWLAKYIALQTGFNIGHCVQPERYLAHDENLMKSYDQAVANITHLMSSGRLEVRDATSGTTTFALQKWVEQARKRNPDKKIAVWLDNFHCLTDPGIAKDPRIGYSAASKRIQNLADTKNCFIGVTAELRKKENRARPVKDDLKETGTLEYDAKGIALVHNDLEVHPETTQIWLDPSCHPPENKKPILHWYIDKNKNLYGVFKGTIKVQFNPCCSQLQEREDRVPRPGGLLQAQPDRPTNKWE
jgi:replicative DNA helicase